MLAVFLLSLVRSQGENDFETYFPSANATPDEMFNKIGDIWLMTFMVMFLMMMIKKFEWGIAAASILCIVSSYIVYALLFYVLDYPNFEIPAPLVSWVEEQSTEDLREKRIEAIKLANLQLKSIICAITLVIGVGCFIGTLKLWQYLVVGLLFALSYYLNEWIIFRNEPVNGMIDPGGAIPVHEFGAYWGMAVGFVIHEKRCFTADTKITTHSIGWIWLSATLLFLLWPSFVCAPYSKDKATEAMGVCFFGGIGSSITAFITEAMSKASQKKKKDPVVFGYCCLAGLVGTSSTLFVVGIWGGLLIGAICGILSVLSFNYLHNWLCHKLGFLDVMGVHNLHGICSWVSMLAAVITLHAKGYDDGYWTLIAYLNTLGFSIGSGAFSGLILRVTIGRRIEDQDFMVDIADFQFPEVIPKKDLEGGKSLSENDSTDGNDTELCSESS